MGVSRFAMVVPALALGACAGLIDLEAPSGKPLADAGSDSASRFYADGGIIDGGTSATDAGAGMTIDGHVTDIYAVPVQNAFVRVGGASMLTDIAGTFHFDNVPPTYDLDVIAQSKNSGKAVTSFRGLTVQHPEVNVEGAYTVRGTTVAGQFTPTVTLGDMEHLYISSVDTATGVERFALTDQVGTWTGEAEWLGGPSATLAYFFLRYTAPEGTEGPPGTFTGSNYKPGTVENDPGSDTTFPATLQTASAANNKVVAGSITHFATISPSALVYTALKNGIDAYGYTLPVAQTTSGTFSIPTLAIDAFKVNVIASTGGNRADGSGEGHYVWAANIDPNASNVELAFPDAAQPTQPNAGVTGIANNQAFTWSAVKPAGVYQLDIACNDGGPTEYHARVFTTDTTATSSDGAAFNAAWPKKAPCTWGVTVYPLIDTVDKVVATKGTLDALTMPNGPQSGSYASVSGIVFTTL